MNRYSLVLGFAFLLGAHAFAEQSIPLDEIWGYNLPGTRDIAGIPLPDQKEGVGQTFAHLNREREYNIEQIRLALAMKPPGEKASPGFVLPRKPDSHILRAVHSSMRRKPNPLKPNTFQVGEEITLVFFSHPLSYYARLKEVKRDEQEITVHYEFEPHTTPESTVHFALIPLGKLPGGEYQVRFEQIPLVQKYRDIGFEPVEPGASTIVCLPFSFTIWEPQTADDAQPEKDVTQIPLNHIWGYDLPGTLDVSEVEPKADPTLPIEELTRRLDVWKIRKVLDQRPKEGEKAGPAFVVIGIGAEALENAEAVFSSEKDRQNVLPPKTDLSLVFFSHLMGHYVRLVAAERSPPLFTVKYRFVAHQKGIMASRFALIPLGQLSGGTYRVKIEQLEPIDELGRPVAPIRDAQRLVSDSFEFKVRKE